MYASIAVGTFLRFLVDFSLLLETRIIYDCKACNSYANW